MGAGRVMSTESLSSGYSTDQQYLPVDTENLDTEDYELWERRYHSPPPPPLHRQREWRQPPSQVGTSESLSVIVIQNIYRERRRRSMSHTRPL